MVEERRLAWETVSKRRLVVEEKKAKLIMEKLRLEIKPKNLGQSQRGYQLNQGFVSNGCEKTAVVIFFRC